MKLRLFSSLSLCALLVATVAMVGCDWSSNGTSTNTSRGAGAQVNWTGVYFGQLSGGRAVADTSGGPITRLVITQAGNRLEVLDNNGSRYEGTVGSPGVVASPRLDTETGQVTYPAGAQIVQSQINWKGRDEVAAKDIEFVGVLYIITVTDVQGQTSTRTQGNNNTTTTDVENGEGVESEKVSVTGPTNSVTTTTTTKVNSTNTTSRSTQTDNNNTTTTSTFNISDANSQYKLQGTWIETEGKVSNFHARSAGSSGVVVTGGN